MRRLLLLASVAAAVAIPSNSASACGSHIGIGDGNVGTVYVVDDGGGADWIYVETNMVFNLQRRRRRPRGQHCCLLGIRFVRLLRGHARLEALLSPNPQQLVRAARLGARLLRVQKRMRS